jgi:hypothetical protein
MIRRAKASRGSVEVEMLCSDGRRGERGGEGRPLDESTIYRLAIPALAHEGIYCEFLLILQ